MMMIDASSHAQGVSSTGATRPKQEAAEKIAEKTTEKTAADKELEQRRKSLEEIADTLAGDKDRVEISDEAYAMSNARSSRTEEARPQETRTDRSDEIKGMPKATVMENLSAAGIEFEESDSVGVLREKLMKTQSGSPTEQAPSPVPDESQY